MFSAYVHPEFGYFCPSPGLRRVMQVAFAFTVFGLIAGANSVATLMADHDPDQDSILTAARLDAAEPAPEAAPALVVKAKARPREDAKADVVKTNVGKIDAVKIDAAKADDHQDATRQD